MPSAAAAALDPRVKPIGGVKPFCGVAVTCDDGPADNLATYASLDVVQPGDVVISTANGFDRVAVIGDLLLGMMKNAGVVAFVTDGSVRDIAGIRAVGLPCYAAGVTPNSPARHGPGTIGFPIVCGGAAVGSGDIVVGDEDGVVVVPFARIEETIGRLRGGQGRGGGPRRQGEGRAEDAAPPPEAEGRRQVQGRGLTAMRIAVIGAGAMGAMFGARFARAGAEVVLFDKDAAHVAAINAKGLTVAGRDGDLHAQARRDHRPGRDRRRSTWRWSWSTATPPPTSRRCSRTSCRARPSR